MSAPTHTPAPWVTINQPNRPHTRRLDIATPADAALISAAPDLLDALQNLMSRAVRDAESCAPEGNEPIWAFIEDAADAIAKAERKI